MPTYESRSAEDGIYHRLESVVNDTQFIGHPRCFDNVTTVTDKNGNVIWMKDGKAHQPVLIGEMMSEASGSRLTAKGNVFPSDDVVSLSLFVLK